MESFLRPRVAARARPQMAGTRINGSTGSGWRAHAAVGLPSSRITTRATPDGPRTADRASPASNLVRSTSSPELGSPVSREPHLQGLLRRERDHSASRIGVAGLLTGRKEDVIAEPGVLLDIRQRGASSSMRQRQCEMSRVSCTNSPWSVPSATKPSNPVDEDEGLHAQILGSALRWNCHLNDPAADT